MIDRHLSLLRARDDISLDEEVTIRNAVSGSRVFARDQTVVRSFQTLDVCLILVSGLAGRVKLMPDGRRQIVQVQTPGDFVDLHSFTLKYLDHDVVALTDCEFAIVPHSRMLEITERQPHLTRVYWFATNLDAAMHREWVVSLALREAISRLAHFLCELHVRFELVGLTDGDAYDLPLTQVKIAECLGLSSVHVNRMIMQAREAGLLEFKAGRLTILNLPRLRQIAQFDPEYLYLDRRSRRN